MARWRSCKKRLNGTEQPGAGRGQEGGRKGQEGAGGGQEGAGGSSKAQLDGVGQGQAGVICTSASCGMS